jgi:hypothetical protein
MLPHACNPSTQETEDYEFKTSLSCIMRSYLNSLPYKTPTSITKQNKKENEGKEVTFSEHLLCAWRLSHRIP